MSRTDLVEGPHDIAVPTFEFPTQGIGHRLHRMWPSATKGAEFFNDEANSLRVRAGVPTGLPSFVNTNPVSRLNRRSCRLFSFSSEFNRLERSNLVCLTSVCAIFAATIASPIGGQPEAVQVCSDCESLGSEEFQSRPQKLSLSMNSTPSSRLAAGLYREYRTRAFARRSVSRRMMITMLLAKAR